MSLPPILAAKLSKRGLLAAQDFKPVENEKDFKGAVMCPNKYNIFHNCTSWCQNYWKGHIAPDPKYTSRVRRMLEKYPLPHNWTEIFDKGIGRYYYWNMESNMVSWLPPRHPKSNIMEPAAKYRMKLFLQNIENANKDDKKKTVKSEKQERHRDRHEKRHHRHDDRSHRKKSRKDEIDPMDPAAYSDIPRGTWSDGLDNNKSKADTTASGVLYQQRPYPSPGDVLAANSKIKSIKKK